LVERCEARKVLFLLHRYPGNGHSGGHGCVQRLLFGSSGKRLGSIHHCSSKNPSQTPSPRTG